MTKLARFIERLCHPISTNKTLRKDKCTRDREREKKKRNRARKMWKIKREKQTLHGQKDIQTEEQKEGEEQREPNQRKHFCCILIRALPALKSNTRGALWIEAPQHGNCRQTGWSGIR